jgi:hypothetical protein
MSLAIKSLTVSMDDGFILIDAKPLCLPHVAVYKRDAARSWSVTTKPVGRLVYCQRCLREEGGRS